jgi:hypothetical protein
VGLLTHHHSRGRPAGNPVRARSSGQKDELYVFLEPGVVGQVAAEAFELDPPRVSIPPLDGLQHPQLRAAMLAVNDELTASRGRAGQSHQRPLGWKPNENPKRLRPVP